ncbi:MAG: bifunctional oligoribonuclease/PAP phosphatase NrnA [Candidatus Sumerlaeales bacterium]|nr:bifunctional oligoribonuclease/PAP phosphatase NrnA [Candidatus Sumerlaeales bacterium]
MVCKSAKIEQIAPIAQCIRDNDEFIIVGHSRPDGDCLGSGLGLMHALRLMEKKTRFHTPGPIPDNLKFLPGVDEILLELPADLPLMMIVVDCSDEERVSDEFKASGFVCSIDHHKSNVYFGNLNWVDEEAAAAAEQIYQLVEELGITMSQEVAQCLYTGMFTDSGGFRFGNTDEPLLVAAAKCVHYGANPAEIAEQVYGSVAYESVELTAKVLGNLHFEYGGKLVWSELRWSDYLAVGGEDMEPEGLVSDMRAIKGVEVSVLVHETEESFARVGFRSRGGVDVADIAAKVGGGGHRAASGALVRVSPFADARDRIINTVRESLEAQGYKRD